MLLELLLSGVADIVKGVISNSDNATVHKVSNAVSKGYQSNLRTMESNYRQVERKGAKMAQSSNPNVARKGREIQEKAGKYLNTIEKQKR